MSNFYFILLLTAGFFLAIEGINDRELEAKLCDEDTTPEMRAGVYKCLETHFPPSIMKTVEECSKEAAPDAKDREEATLTLCSSRAAKRRMTHCIRGRGMAVLRNITLAKLEEISREYKKCAASALNMTSQSEPASAIIDPIEEPSDDANSE